MSVARISYTERVHLFGLAGYKSNTTTVRTPWGIEVVTHKIIAPLFVWCCYEARRRSDWRPKSIESFKHRPIRNSLSTDLHSWALAWDFLTIPPGAQDLPGKIWQPLEGVPAHFAAPFLEQGFTWKATWTRNHMPHIEWAGGKPGPIPSGVDQPPGR